MSDKPIILRTVSELSFEKTRKIMVHSFAPETNDFFGESLEDLSLPESDVWVDLQQPTPEEVAYVQQRYALSQKNLFLSDVLADASRERVRAFGKLLFICIEYDEDEFLWMLSAPNFILTFHQHPCALIPQALAKCDTIEQVPWKIFNEVASFMSDQVENSEMDIDATREVSYRLAESDHNDLLTRVDRARKYALLLRRRLQSKTELIRMIVSAEIEHLKPTHHYLQEEKEHLITLLRTVQTSIEAANMLESNFIARINLHIAAEAQKANLATKVLTLVATIMLPLTLLSGIFGMNVWFPGRVEDTTTWTPFLTIIGMMGAVAGVMLWGFRASKLM